jgi:hypothetical protein
MSKLYLQPATDVYGMSFSGVLCEGTFPQGEVGEYPPGGGDIVDP